MTKDKPVLSRFPTFTMIPRHFGMGMEFPFERPQG